MKLIKRKSKKENMGLTTWKNAPDGKILETDVTIAKNYLSQEEITELNNLVSMYLNYSERQVKLGKIISMKDWKEKLEIFLINCKKNSKLLIRKEKI